MNRLITILCIIFLFGFQNCESKNEKQRYAEMLIEKVERFKLENDRLPNNVQEFGLMEKENDPAFYQMQSDSNYIIWYGLGLGESKVYNSSTKRWRTGG